MGSRHNSTLLESKVYACSYKKEMDMVFNKAVERDEIEQFERDCVKKITDSAIFMRLKRALDIKKLSFNIEVQHTEPNLKKYCSHFVINIINKKGEMVFEDDEPNCCLMLCETICFIRNGHIIGIDLLSDKEFLESLELLIKQVSKCA